MLYWYSHGRKWKQDCNWMSGCLASFSTNTISNKPTPPWESSLFWIHVVSHVLLCSSYDPHLRISMLSVSLVSWWEVVRKLVCEVFEINFVAFSVHKGKEQFFPFFFLCIQGNVQDGLYYFIQPCTVTLQCRTIYQVIFTAKKIWVHGRSWNLIIQIFISIIFFVNNFANGLPLPIFPCLNFYLMDVFSTQNYPAYSGPWPYRHVLKVFVHDFQHVLITILIINGYCQWCLW